MEGRSYEEVTPEELEVLLKVVLDDFEDFIRRKPRYRPLKDALLLIALCQRAAMHYINGITLMYGFSSPRLSAFLDSRREDVNPTISSLKDLGPGV